MRIVWLLIALEGLSSIRGSMTLSKLALTEKEVTGTRFEKKLHSSVESTAHLPCSARKRRGIQICKNQLRGLKNRSKRLPGQMNIGIEELASQQGTLLGGTTRNSLQKAVTVQILSIFPENTDLFSRLQGLRDLIYNQEDSIAELRDLHQDTRTQLNKEFEATQDRNSSCPGNSTTS